MGDQELTLESVTNVAVEEMTDEHKSFLTEHQEELSDEQKETYKDILSTKKGEDDDEEEEEEVDIEPTVRKEDKKTEKKVEGEDDEVDPEDRKVIEKTVNKQLESVKEGLAVVQEIKDQQEVSEFISQNQEFGKYKSSILKHMKHPSYKNVPVANLAYMIAGKDLMKLGAEAERRAAKKANDTKGGSKTVRQAPVDDDAATTDFAKFEKMASGK